MSKRELPVIQARSSTQSYDCNQCVAYCCAYDWIAVTKRDIQRLANRFKLTRAQAEKRLTQMIKGYGRVLRHRKDHIYGVSCMFLDGKTRRCTVYEHRPGVCRSFPHKDSCHYFDYLMAEREHQDNDKYVPFGAAR